MTNDELQLRAEDAVLELRAEAQEARELELRLLRWDEVGTTTEGREAFRRGAFADVDPGRVVIESTRHGGPLVGAGFSLEERDDGPYLRARVSRTRDGDELLELARDGVLRDASVVFRPLPGGSRRRSDGVIERTRVELRRVAVLERGAYPGAEVVSVRHAPEEVPPMPADELTLDAIRETVRGIVAEAIPSPIVQVPAPIAGPEPSLLERSGSFSEVYGRILDGDVELARALADGVTADVPSIVRPAWLDRIATIIPAARPCIAAFGRESLPDSGLEVDWPTFDGDYAARVGVQGTEKTEVTSKKITLASDKAAVATYAGGLDMSWQVLRRSSPSYRDAALRILSIAWAIETEKAFAAAITAKARGFVTFDPAATDADGSKLRAALLEASAAVDDATGTPATFVLAAPDAWLAMGGRLMNPQYGTVNQPGVASAATLRVEANGLPIIRAKGLAAGTILAGNGEAASWLEEGMLTATQDVVAKLGTDVVVWSLGAPAVFIPAGIVALAKTKPVAPAPPAK